MRYAISIIIIFTAVVGAYFYFSSRQTSNLQPQQSNLQPASPAGRLPTSNVSTPTPLTTNNLQPTTIIEYDARRFALYIQPITNPSNLMLIPNFTEKKSSQELMEENKCRYGISGGFYTTDNKPLGLLVVDGKQFAPLNNTSDLINGFFFKAQDNMLYLSTKEEMQLQMVGISTEFLSFALQSGPYFTPQSVLKIKDDEYARRMLVGKDSNGKFYFIAITEEENAHSGPLLADLPNIIKELNSMNLNAIPYTLNAILNLDGGSASALYSKEGIKLQELVSIGSLLCGR